MALVGLLFNCVFKWVFNLHVGEDAKSHWLHLFVFSPRWALNVPEYCLYHCECVNCALKLLAQKDTIPHWLQLFDLSHNVSFSTCILKWKVQAYAILPQSSHLSKLSPLCVLIWVLKLLIWADIYNSTCRICLIFLQCASEFSNGLL